MVDGEGEGPSALREGPGGHERRHCATPRVLTCRLPAQPNSPPHDHSLLFPALHFFSVLSRLSLDFTTLHTSVQASLLHLTTLCCLPARQPSSTSSVPSPLTRYSPSPLHWTQTRSAACESSLLWTLVQLVTLQCVCRCSHSLDGLSSHAPSSRFLLRVARQICARHAHSRQAHQVCRV